MDYDKLIKIAVKKKKVIIYDNDTCYKTGNVVNHPDGFCVAVKDSDNGLGEFYFPGLDLTRILLAGEQSPKKRFSKNKLDNMVD